MSENIISLPRSDERIKDLSDMIADLFGFNIMLGFELELYVYAKPFSEEQKKIDLLDLLPSLKELLNCHHVAVSEERGKNQIEIASTHILAPIETLHTLSDIKKKLCHYFKSHKSLGATCSSKPYSKDYGSSLQLNISLHKIRPYAMTDDLQENNIFSVGKIAENKAFQHCIAGILNSTNELTYIFAISEAFFLRLQSPLLMAPNKLSWGYNNRTTLIRIPESGGRRIEYRLGGSDSCYKGLITALLVSIAVGLHEKKLPPPPTYTNAYDSSMTPLCGSLKLAIRHGNSQKYIDKIEIIKKTKSLGTYQ